MEEVDVVPFEGEDVDEEGIVEVVVDVLVGIIRIKEGCDGILSFFECRRR